MTPAVDDAATIARYFGTGSRATSLMAQVDWRSNPLVRPDGWPALLRITLRNLLASPESLFLVWGDSRTFFFSDYAGLKEKRGQVLVNTVPTDKTRIGDFSDFRDTSGIQRIYPLLRANFDLHQIGFLQHFQMLRNRRHADIESIAYLPCRQTVASGQHLDNAKTKFGVRTICQAVAQLAASKSIRE